MATSNRLAREKSPYLLQHAHNPVDWFPWGDEAFETAAREDKPIFLSIGYSTCHWCHVMEKETFENEEAAQLMNDAFVSIKVDREERPDIDHLYMPVCNLMTGSGGWPMSIVMTPDKRPFFAGTYIPRESRMGRLGMMDLVPRIKERWMSHREEVLGSAERVAVALVNLPEDVRGDRPDAEVARAAYDQLAQRFDSRRGGFGSAPKFPTAHNLFFLLRYYRRTDEEHALEMVEKTLDELRKGGIYDHVGFGFHRYSTDENWFLPHFEKMLYDQAMLALAYTEAYQATGKELYARTVHEIFTYVLRDMSDPGGGFYSAEDADSEGVEGKFYVWTLSELREALGEEDSRFAARVFHTKSEGNYHDEATGRMSGANILHLEKSTEEIAAEFGLPVDGFEARLDEILKRLCQHREHRVRPHRDDKILTDWNGLMIAAFARAAAVFDRPDYAAVAAQAADFIFTAMRGPDGRILHRYRDGEAAIPACVDDYAFLIWGLIDLYEATFDLRWLHDALALNQEFLDRFWDDKSGGFFFTPSDGERLLVRKKESYDGATPSGNSVAALNLLRLGRITADVNLEQKFDEIGRAFAGAIRQFPSAYTQFLTALEFALGPSFEVVIAGDMSEDDTRILVRTLRRPFIPNKTVFLRQTARAAELAALAPYTAAHEEIGGHATAYVCSQYKCDLPTTDPEAMLERLGVTVHTNAPSHK